MRISGGEGEGLERTQVYQTKDLKLTSTTSG